MGKKSKLAALALGACMALGLVCVTACEGTAGKDGKSAYDIWLEQGNTGTEQDFLDSLKGTPGAPGKAPEITVGENGNWFVDGVDTHQKAQGNDGTTPEITISDDGYWEVNGEKTSQKAQGNDGAPGAAGTKGTEWHLSDTNPTESEGEIGDFWLNKTDWTVWHKKSKTEWENLGTIKGKDGSGGVTPAEGTAVDIAADGNKEISVNLSEGTHIIVADLGSAEFAGRVQVHVGSEVSELVKSESRSAAKGSNIYYGYINVKEDTKTITIYAIDADFKATINYEDWTVPSLKADDKTVEIPINAYGAGNPLKINIDSSVQAGAYKIKLFADTLNHSLDFAINDGTGQTFSSAYYSASTGIGGSGNQKTITFNVTGSGDTLCLTHKASSDTFIYPALISISD